jgi:hypothetical protein
MRSTAVSVSLLGNKTIAMQKPLHLQGLHPYSKLAMKAST